MVEARHFCYSALVFEEAFMVGWEACRGGKLFWPSAILCCSF